MANQLSNCPIVVDTTMTGGAGLGRPVHVRKVIWYNPADTGPGSDTFLIVDPTSTPAIPLLKGVESSANTSQTWDFNPPVVWRDFQVTLTGTNPGSVIIWY